MIRKRPHCVRVAKIHAQLYRRELRAFSIPVGHVDGVAQKRLVYRHAVPVHQHEMDLVDVKRVQFLRPIFDDPVLYVSLVRDDVRHAGRRIENRRRLPIHRDEERCGPVRIRRILRPLRKIKFPHAHRLCVSNPCGCDRRPAVRAMPPNATPAQARPSRPQSSPADAWDRFPPRAPYPRFASPDSPAHFLARL